MVVLITGATGGLGPTVVRAFETVGATVVAASRTSADLTDPAQVKRLISSIGPIDALVHLAGGFSGGTVHETDDQTWNRMMDMNLRSAFHVFREVVPHMRAAGRGRIVAIASKAAVDTAPGVAAYAASKAALVSLIRSISLENKEFGITANAILPGTIDTEANRQWGSPEERATWVSPERIAALAVFLVSDDGADVNGAALPMYGGA